MNTTAWNFKFIYKIFHLNVLQKAVVKTHLKIFFSKQVMIKQLKTQLFTQVIIVDIAHNVEALACTSVNTPGDA